jgi:hypothetical protein
MLRADGVKQVQEDERHFIDERRVAYFVSEEHEIISS